VATIQNSLLRALAHRNYRLYFVGQGVSLVGTWMQQLALSWVVYQLTDSAVWLGVVGFAGQIPGFFLAPVAGVVADHYNRHRLLLLTQTLMMLQAFALAALALAGVITVWQIIVLSVLLGVVNALDMTVRQAFLTELIERREDLANAIALNSSMVNGSRLVGPALAGFLLAQTSAGVCFLINGVSYLAVLAALLAMTVRPASRPARRPPLLRGLREGFRYAFGFTPIRALLALLALVSLASMAYTVLLPVFADRLVGGGAATLGLLTAATGVGALTAAVFLASRQTVLGLGKWIAAAPAVFSAALFVFSASRNLWLSMLMLFLAGAALMMQMAATNTILQTIVEEDKRGRVMSFYTMAFLGMAPLGSLMGGLLAERIGAPGTVRVAAAACLVGSALFAVALPSLREEVRPIYRRMGILPELATGVQSATELNVPPERP
jgi:MFS family permease